MASLPGRPAVESDRASFRRGLRPESRTGSLAQVAMSLSMKRATVPAATAGALPGAAAARWRLPAAAPPRHAGQPRRGRRMLPPPKAIKGGDRADLSAAKPPVVPPGDLPFVGHLFRVWASSPCPGQHAAPSCRSHPSPPPPRAVPASSLCILVHSRNSEARNSRAAEHLASRSRLFGSQLGGGSANPGGLKPFASQLAQIDLQRIYKSVEEMFQSTGMA